MLTPSPADVREQRESLDRFLNRSDVRFLVPMYEPEDPMGQAPLGTLDYLLEDVGVAPERILVLDQGSAPGPRSRAEAAGVSVVPTLGAARSLPTSFLDRFGLPALERGKGLNLFLGLLALDAEPEPPTWVVFADADLRDLTSYDFARYLAWPMGQPDKPRMSVATHVGRNNEVVLALRFALEAIAHSPAVDPAQRTRVAALWPGLCRQVHMLGGERIVSFRDLLRTPITTGYGVETCLTLAAIERGLIEGNEGIAQVVNPAERHDIPNGREARELVWTEQRMMNSIARLLFYLVLHDRPLPAWDEATVRSANIDLGRMLPGVPLLPAQPGPMDFATVPDERFLPPIEALEAPLRDQLGRDLRRAR